ncbi:MAG: autorepressor SdpR family transcription factor [Treponema sp.]
MNDIWEAVADKSRRQILSMLKKKSMTAGEIAEHFSMSKPSISHHLSILLSAGLITVEKEGQNRIYSVNMTVAQELIELVAKMTEKENKRSKK